MPKEPISFGDGLQRIVADLAQMELDPGADRNLINTIREQIISFQQQAGQQQPTMAEAGPDSGPGAIPGTLEMPAPGMEEMGMPGMPSPIPVATTEADMSRGPRQNPDMGGAVEELSRLMAGS